MKYLSLRKVADPTIHPALEEVHLRQDHLVVEALELRQECVDEGQRRLVLLCL